MTDAVISWVDGADPAHAARRARYLRGGEHAAATAPTRFASSGELRYAVLSVLRFAPFVRRVFIVTDRQRPHPVSDLIAARPERIRVVDHAEIYGEHADLLPVFSSRSIETMMHRIPGLAERFVYLNDDIFFARPAAEADLFDGARPVLRGTMRVLPHPALAWAKRMLRGERPGYGAAQRAAARALGRRDHLLVEHQPQPMRRGTLAEHYAGRTDVLRAQAGHRFRSAAQISPVGLAHHLELERGARVLPPRDVGYVRPGRPTGAALRDVMEALNADAFASFCVQSLDAMDETDRAIVRAGLERRYGEGAPA